MIICNLKQTIQVYEKCRLFTFSELPKAMSKFTSEGASTLLATALPPRPPGEDFFLVAVVIDSPNDPLWNEVLTSSEPGNKLTRVSRLMWPEGASDANTHSAFTPGRRCARKTSRRPQGGGALPKPDARSTQKLACEASPCDSAELAKKLVWLNSRTLTVAGKLN
jgi:hypothetical protein